MDSWSLGMILYLLVGLFVGATLTLIGVAIVSGRKMPHHFVMGECLRCGVAESGVFAAMECPEG